MEELISGLTKNNMSTIVEHTLYQQLVSTFQELETVQEPADLTERRRQAFERFQQEGFPTVKHEEWKYTNLHPLTNTPYVLNADVNVDDIDVSKADIPGLDVHRIVLANGQYLLALYTLEADIRLTVTPFEEDHDKADLL